MESNPQGKRTGRSGGTIMDLGTACLLQFQMYSCIYNIFLGSTKLSTFTKNPSRHTYIKHLNDLNTQILTENL